MCIHTVEYHSALWKNKCHKISHMESNCAELIEAENKMVTAKWLDTGVGDKGAED